MVTTESIIVALETAGYTFALDAQTHKITHRWTRSDAPSIDWKPLLLKLRERRDEVASLLDRWSRVRPHLSGDTLVIPFDCHPRYRWWDDRDESNPPLTVCAILTELDAPARLHRSYCGTCGRAALHPVDAPVGQDRDIGPAVPLERTGT